MSLELQNQLYEAVQQIADVIVELWKRVVEKLREMARALSDGIHHMLKKTNPRLYYLAYHGSTARIRKKNRQRLWRMWLRCRC